MLLFSTKFPSEIATALAIATSTLLTEASRYIQWTLYFSIVLLPTYNYITCSTVSGAVIQLTDHGVDHWQFLRFTPRIGCDHDDRSSAPANCVPTPNSTDSLSAAADGEWFCLHPTTHEPEEKSEPDRSLRHRFGEAILHFASRSVPKWSLHWDHDFFEPNRCRDRR